MLSEIISSWAEHDQHLRALLSRAESHIRIFDGDLGRLKLESADNAAMLADFLAGNRARRLVIVLRDPGPFRRSSPRLARLHGLHAAQMSVIECPAHLVELKDCLFLVDDRHALIRFHQDAVRSRAIVDDSEASRAYHRRFDDILGEGGEEIAATTLGL